MQRHAVCSVQEKAAFDETQVGRSVAMGMTNITIFHERTPTDSLPTVGRLGSGQWFVH